MPGVDPRSSAAYEKYMPASILRQLPLHIDRSNISWTSFFPFFHAHVVV